MFRSAFKDPGPESSVCFTAARSFNRNVADSQESTRECVGVSVTSSGGPLCAFYLTFELLMTLHEQESSSSLMSCFDEQLVQT